VSPVGMNKQLVEDGSEGFLAKDNAGWIKALTALRDDRALRRLMGRSGRKKVEAEYSLHMAAPRLEELIRRTVSLHPRRPAGQ
jgi:glycosyltransferase involved in cell wall biosynthesis